MYKDVDLLVLRAFLHVEGYVRNEQCEQIAAHLPRRYSPAARNSSFLDYNNFYMEFYVHDRDMEEPKTDRLDEHDHMVGE